MTLEKLEGKLSFKIIYSILINKNCYHLRRMNKMNSRLQQIIQQLLTTDELQTSAELAAVLQVSSKTIQNDMKELSKLLNNDTASIESHRGKGYRINIIDENKFKHFLKQTTEKDNQVIPTEPEDRIQFLMEKLLLQSAYIKMDDLADELFISRSTLQSDLNSVRRIGKLSFVFRPKTRLWN